MDEARYEWRKVPINSLGWKAAVYQAVGAAGINTLGDLADFLRDHEGQLLEMVSGAPASVTAKYLSALTKTQSLMNKLHAATGNYLAQVVPREDRTAKDKLNRSLKSGPKR